ncbi:hypothetical protein FRB95_008010 [Tulasnella sp. JGI-2019a]|nr:hypothetical protein FRB95_008010 [Tulasnella sp. JGI-2019a]
MRWTSTQVHQGESILISRNLTDIGSIDQAIHPAEETCEIMKQDLAFKPPMKDQKIVQHKYTIRIGGNG